MAKDKIPTVSNRLSIATRQSVLGLINSYMISIQSVVPRHLGEDNEDGAERVRLWRETVMNNPSAHLQYMQDGMAELLSGETKQDQEGAWALYYSGHFDALAQIVKIINFIEYGKDERH